MSAPLTSLDSSPTAKQEANRVMVRYLAIATLAGIVDWLTKVMAVNLLTDNSYVLTDRFSLMLVFNTGGAGGVTIGPATWLINVCVTAFSILMITMVVRPLAAVDRRASRALGLVAGGAMGNFVSMLVGPEGVTDFLAFRFSESAIVANVADLALWSGAIMLAPVVRSLIRAIRAEQRAKDLARQARGVRYIEA